MTEIITKKCKQCEEEKVLSQDFYSFKGFFRTICKACSSKNNRLHSKARRKKVGIQPITEERKAYMREYFKNNKDKFVNYRKQFLDNHPDYFRTYYRNKLNGKKKSG